MQIASESILVPVQFTQQVTSSEKSDAVQTTFIEATEKTTELSSSTQQSGITQKAVESAIQLLNNSTNPVQTLKKILTNKQFLELNIDDCPELKKAFEAFLNAIDMDSSQILNELKFQLQHQTKFTGDFFIQLKDLLTQLPDSRLKNAVSQLLRAYDCYLTMENNEAATQALLENMIKQAIKSQDRIFELIGQNLISKDADSENLPESVKTVLSRLAEQLTAKAMRETQTQLNDTGTQADPELTALLQKQVPSNKTETAVYKALSSSALEERPVIISIESAISQLEESLPQEAKAELQQLAQQISDKSALPQKQALFSALKEKLLPFLKENTSSSQAVSTVYEAVEKLVQQETRQLVFAHSQTSKETSSYEQDSRTLYSLLTQRLIDNKCSYNLEILKNEVLPKLLQNRTPALEQKVSLLTQNIMRVKDGQPDSIWQTAENLFSYLESNSNISQEEILQLRFSLFENLQKAVSERNQPTDAFAKLMQAGVENSSSSAGKASFQELLWSLVLKSNVNLPVQYFFLPIHYGNIYLISEIWKSNKKQLQLEEDEEGNKKEVIKDVYKLFLTFDIENVGYFESSIFYNDRNFAIELSMPDSLREHRESIRQNILSIIENNNMTVGSMVFCNENERKKATKIIDSLI